MFGSKGRKERKRLIALLLAGTMVLSGMGINPISVQAEETVVEQVQETEPVEAVIEEQGEEQGEETVSGGDVVMPEAEETEVLETEETGEASAPVVQNADGIYVFEAAIDAIISKLEKKAAIPEGKYGTDNYFTLSGTATRGNSNTYSAELGKAENGTLSFTVQGTASVTISITSTGSSNTSDFALLKSDGTKVIPDGETTGIITVYGTDPVKEVKYSKLEAGTYQICSPKDGNNTGRGVRILSAKVSDTTGGSRPARADWSTVEAPTLVSAKQITDKNDIEVKVTGLVGYDGADTLVITMKDEAGTVVKTQSVAKDGKDFTVTFTPENSGKYVFSVVATRDGEENKAAENTLDVDFALVLATPVISSATSKGNNSVEVIWGAVKEATGYIVTAATEGEKDVSVIKKLMKPQLF